MSNHLLINKKKAISAFHLVNSANRIAAINQIQKQLIDNKNLSQKIFSVVSKTQPILSQLNEDSTVKPSLDENTMKPLLSFNGCVVAPGANLFRGYLDNEDLTGAKLNGADLREAQLYKANLTDATLNGADLRGARLCEVKFIRSDLTRTDLRFSNLERSDLTGAKLTGSDLTGAYLTGANLTNAHLIGVKSGNIISDANTKLPNNWTLIKGYLVGPGADLTGRDLRGADLSDVDLSGANLTGVISGKIIGTPKTLPESWQLIKEYLIGPGANLTNANLSKANLLTATLTGVISGGISGKPSNLPNQWKLINGYLIGPGANLTKANLSGSDLTGSDLTGANLTGAYLTKANLTRVILSGAKITSNTNITKATISSDSKKYFSNCKGYSTATFI